jgi:hypothetical protein
MVIAVLKKNLIIGLVLEKISQHHDIVYFEKKLGY